MDATAADEARAILWVLALLGGGVLALALHVYIASRERRVRELEEEIRALRDRG